jgi:hypothetical protein
MSIKLECRDGSVTIPKKYYEDYLCEEWFFNSLIKFESSGKETLESDHITIEIWENKAAILSLFDSLRFMKLTVHDGVSLDYLENLADMWCSPQWIIEAIQKQRLDETKSKLITTDKLNILNHAFKCMNCSAGFREIDNHESACYHHNRLFNHNTGTYNCCNRTRDDRGCIIGCHVTQTYDYNLIYNLINKNKDE